MPQRALLLWVNSPGNPAGQLDDLATAASWGRQRGVLVASDECYAEMTWKGRPHTVIGEWRGSRRDRGGTGRPFRFKAQQPGRVAFWLVCRGRGGG